MNDNCSDLFENSLGRLGLLPATSCKFFRGSAIDLFFLLCSILCNCSCQCNFIQFSLDRN